MFGVMDEKRGNFPMSDVQGNDPVDSVIEIIGSSQILATAQYSIRFHENGYVKVVEIDSKYCFHRRYHRNLGISK